jgi:hypothetical protein
MLLHARALYRCDPRGRLLETNEPAGRSAPRFWLGRTPLGNVWRFRADVPDATLRRLARLAARETALPRAASPPPPERERAIREALEADAPIAAAWRGPAFRFPAAIPEPGARVRSLGPSDTALLGHAFAWLAAELDARAPCFAVVEAGRAVAACWSSRVDPAAAEAGIETLEGHRGRGHARALAAAWARAVRAAGREPLYSTSWQNLASLGVTRSLGLLRYGEDVHFS